MFDQTRRECSVQVAQAPQKLNPRSNSRKTQYRCLFSALCLKFARTSEGRSARRTILHSLNAHDFTSTFHKNAISPNAIHLTYTFSIAYFSKPTGLVEGDTGYIFGENIRL
jgi:hypothetical protein